MYYTTNKQLNYTFRRLSYVKLIWIRGIAINFYKKKINIQLALEKLFRKSLNNNTYRDNIYIQYRTSTFIYKSQKV